MTDYINRRIIIRLFAQKKAFIAQRNKIGKAALTDAFFSKEKQPIAWRPAAFREGKNENSALKNAGSWLVKAAKGRRVVGRRPEPGDPGRPKKGKNMKKH